MAARADSPLTLVGPAGAIEAALTEPDGAVAPDTFAVVCHPHPLHDGTMDNKVVHTLARSFAKRGVPAIRFNFRGVGGSAGAYDAGDGEVEDTLAVSAYMRERFGDRPAWLAGFSFGSFVALRAATRAPCAGLVMVAPPVQRFPFDQALPDCPILVIQGDADDVVDCADVQAWAYAAKPMPRFELLPGVGHFFHGHLNDLRKILEAFLGDA
ncbi:MAG: alpha/beta fold hydrolase [Gammaproteobacteria bacterium]